jgi:glutamine synthetase
MNIQTKISNGFLAKRGLLDNDAIAAAAALLARVADSNLETVRVLFADQHGILRGKTIVVGAFDSVFTTGIAVPSTLLLKDTAHKTVFPVWSSETGIEGGMSGAGDILLVPDSSTFRILPWSKHSAWIFCDPYFKSGDSIPFAPRSVLRSATQKLADKGYKMLTGLEVEFHVFKTVNPKLDHASSTMPGQAPETQNLAQGYQFLTEARYDALEPVIDMLRQHCQALDIPIRSMEIEMGPSQLEFTFDPADPMTHADNMMMFRAMVKEVCAREGLHAT